MDNILVTGAKGFLGRSLSKYYTDIGNTVYGIGHGQIVDNEISNYGLHKWIESEITIEALNSFNVKFDMIIHCAGSGSVGYSVEFPYQDYKRSVDSTLNILEYIRLYNKNATFVYTSSPAVQGFHDNLPIKEGFQGEPASPYGLNKKVAEELCWSYSKFYNIKVVVLRYFSIYGKNLKKQLLWDALNKFDSDNFNFFGTGEETRDWIYIDDAVMFTYKILNNNNNNKFEVYNVGSGKSISIKETLLILKKELNINSDINFNGVVKKGDPKFYCADMTKSKELNLKVSIDLKSGIKKYVNWYKGMIN